MEDVPDYIPESEECHKHRMAPNTVILSSALGPGFRKQKFLTQNQVFNVQAKLPIQALGVRKEGDTLQHDSVCEQNSSSATVTSTITTEGGPTTPVSLLDLLPNSESSSGKKEKKKQSWRS